VLLLLGAGIGAASAVTFGTWFVRWAIGFERCAEGVA
jgi:hypothetical protein